MFPEIVNQLPRILGLAVICASCVPQKTKPQVPRPVAKIEKISAEEAVDKSLFDLSEMGPYFAQLLGGEAATALSEDRLVDALELFDEIVAQTSDIVITPRARFVAAYLAERLGNNERALAELPPLAEELPLLADMVRERSALAALRLGKCERAIELAVSVDGESTSGPDATMIRADALRSLDRLEDATDVYEGYLEQWPDGARQFEARARIVECQARLIEEGQAGEDTAAKGIELLEQLRAQAPTNRWTEIAAKCEETFSKQEKGKLPRKKRDRKATQAAYEKASKLMRKMRNKDAERAFDRVIRLARSNGKLACRARYERAIVISRQREHERAANSFLKAIDRCSAPDILIRAIYRGAKAYQSAAIYHQAIRLYGRVESDFASHSFADDARLHAARCHLALGERDKFIEMLESLPDVYPAGDMRAEALWTVSHDALKRNELPAAREALERYYKLFPKESGWYASGRSGYWLGRVEERLGDAENAALRYEQVISGSPLTFYMVLAYNRLAAIDDKRAQQLIEELAPRSDEIKALFPKSLLEDFPTIAKGIELYRLGLPTLARRELDQLITQPDLPPEVHWLTAAILRRAGSFHEAKEAVAGADNGWNGRYPTGRDFVHWSLAYPTAYEDEVNEAASQTEVEPAMIWAVMREESSFNPEVESWANAIGLMQLILPTARSMGKRLGIRANRRTLRRPDVNIRLGTAYLDYLKKMFDDHPALMIAGYNAGEGAVGKWVKARPGDDLDIFIEDIPYDQTRGYTKRVIATFAIYLFLYGETRSILSLDLKLPTVR